MKPRNGKIAKLPEPIREQLNARLHGGETAVSLMQWLNTLPEVRAVLAQKFGGRPLNSQNLTEWRQGGYQQWLNQPATGASLWERDPVFRELFCSVLHDRLKETVAKLMEDITHAVLKRARAEQPSGLFQPKIQPATSQFKH
jgi:hypothetical protein